MSIRQAQPEQIQQHRRHFDFPPSLSISLRSSLLTSKFEQKQPKSTAARNKLLYMVTMHGLRQTLFQSYSQLHVLSCDGPSETLKKKVAELEKLRRRKNRKKDQLFVEVPESRSYLDTATMPMILIVVGGALFAKLLMMYDELKSQEMIERKIKNAPPGQGTVRMLDREEWEEIKDVRPRTPFESKLARPNARIRTGEPLCMDDLKDWTIDVLTDALTRAEERVRRSSKLYRDRIGLGV